MAKRKKKRKTKKSPGAPAGRSQQTGPVIETVGVGRPSGEKKWLPRGIAGLALAAGVVLVFLFLRPGTAILKDGGLNVVLLTLDTTRADRLGCYGYAGAHTPNIDFLAQNGVRFENAYCHVPLTGPSHCSILTGTLPPYHQVRNNGTYSLPQELRTLAEIMKGQGLETSAFVSSFTVDSRFGLDQGFDIYDDSLSPDQVFKALNSERRADAVFASFSRWMDEGRKGRFFSWIHFFDPHVPYDPPSPYREDFPDAPYDGEIAFMDFHVGKVVDKLREHGLLEKTLIVVAGDHGEAFGEKNEEGHGAFVYESTMRVPLILFCADHLPPGKLVEARVRLVDVMPTVLDLMRIPVPGEVQGLSLLPSIDGKKTQDLVTYIESFYTRENYGWSELVGIIDGDWKYIRAPKPELYNLERDPREELNLYPNERDIALEKDSRLKALIESSIPPDLAAKRALTSEDREKLRSLGYIAMSDTPAGDLPDPKDRTEELLLLQKAQQFETEGRFPEAASVYEDVLAMRPEVATSYVNLALMRARMMDFEETLRILELGLERIPESEILLSRLGHTYMLLGRVKKALESFDLILKNNPRYFDALLGSAWMLDQVGQPDEAQAYYRKALEVEPENKFARKNYANSLASSKLFSRAVDVYLGLKKDFPDDHEILQDLGIALGYMGDVVRSIENLEEAVRLHPTPVAYYNLAVAMKKTGNIEAAVRYLKLYLENPEGEDQGSIDAARAELTRLEDYLKRNPVPLPRRPIS